MTDRGERREIQALRTPEEPWTPTEAVLVRLPIDLARKLEAHWAATRPARPAREADLSALVAEAVRQYLAQTERLKVR